MICDWQAKLSRSSKIIFLGLVLGLNFNFVLANWVAPTAPPVACPDRDPGCMNLLTVSNLGQSKLGSLGIDPGGLFVRGLIRATSTNLYFDGDLVPFGMTPCSNDQAVYKSSSSVPPGKWVCGDFAPSVWIATSTDHYNNSTPNSLVNSNLGNFVHLEKQLSLDNATSTGNAGIIKLGGENFIHNYKLNNAFLGGSSGRVNLLATGNDNTGLGDTVLGSLSSGSNNTAIGLLSLGTTNTGYANTGIGRRSMEFNTSGSENTVIGHYAYYHNVSRASSTAIGAQALYSSPGTSGSENTAIGAESLFTNLHGRKNIAVGTGSLYSNTNGASSTVIGVDSLRVNTTGSFNATLGYKTLFSNVSGASTTAVGSFALYYKTFDQGDTGRVSVGAGALFNCGRTAMTDCSSHTAVGYQALHSDIDRNNHTALGYQSLYSSIGGVSDNNTAVGASALYDNSSGFNNTAVGSSALAGGAGGGGEIDNTAVGYNVFTAIGGGVRNTAVGASAGKVLSSTHDNIFFGENTGSNITTGNGNTFIGAGAGTTSSATISYSTAIGYNSHPKANNTMTLGSEGVVYGSGAVNVGIGTSSPAYRLEIVNFAGPAGQGRANAWQTYSSIRWKENVTEITNALSTLKQLRGVTFDWKKEYGGKPDLGFIAEEVGKVIPEIVDWEADGIYAKALNYDHLIPLLTEAIKEQQEEIERQNRELDSLLILAAAKGVRY